MSSTSIELDVDQWRTLETLAAAEGQTVPTLVRRAVDVFIDRFASDRVSPMGGLADLAAEIQRRVPPDWTPDEIEADITLAREEVRQARRAARGG